MKNEALHEGKTYRFYHHGIPYNSLFDSVATRVDSEGRQARVLTRYRVTTSHRVTAPVRRAGSRCPIEKTSNAAPSSNWKNFDVTSVSNPGLSRAL